MDWQVTKGTAAPLGATLTATGCNFAIHAPNAKGLTLVIFDDNNDHHSIPLYKNHSHIYSAHVSGIQAGMRYAYSVISPKETLWLLDPYAHQLTDNPLSETVPTAVIRHHGFDWQNTEKPQIEQANTLVYELHVKGFTQLHPDIPTALQGKYLGLCHPACIEHFKSLGITTLQLMPIATSLDEAHLHDKELTNFWGYNPLCWFAPDTKFAISDPITELKTMVRTLHQHGIEVILDVVYNHTAESGHGGPIFNFKQLAPKAYLMNGQGEFENYSGCGNTVDLNYPPVLRTVMDSLRHWVEEYQIDGFRFDLAATLGRRGPLFDRRSAFFQSIHQDPVLQSTKLIAEPWDIGPNGYQLGGFPMRWNECNDKFRDITRSFWNHKTSLGDFATRLMGSRDLFSASKWPDKLSVNYISYHDGFTLQDLVSYNHKHNEANKESNRDGHGDNRSFNHGIEGPTDTFAIINLRERQKRNLITSLLFSFGIPHLLAVDSLSHTQKGNNNAYCQDSEISWANWQLNKVQDDFQQWLQKIIAARSQFMVPFIEGFSGESRGEHRINWMKPNSQRLNVDDWHQHSPIILHLGLYHCGSELLYLINPDKVPTRFRLPKGSPWEIICDTADLNPSQPTVCTTHMQSAHSMTILHRR
ncbi:glycogen debranching protein GlgX [Photobacterium swingsii]|uniref:glycogen debranching protein GlgX n=1 Tax=Photobacterium swingsii TaxID=680026 RepID=UPI004068E3E0